MFLLSLRAGGGDAAHGGLLLRGRVPVLHECRRCRQGLRLIQIKFQQEGTFHAQVFDTSVARRRPCRDGRGFQLLLEGGTSAGGGVLLRPGVRVR